jgi:hypothetical protein
VNYDEDKLIAYYQNFRAAQIGSELHEHAKRCIELGTKLMESKKTLNMFVNDAIGFQMTPEQPLYYSDNCFGTADAISFKNNMLRIHDLKTGSTPAHMEQLIIYAALFCLEYGVKPKDIQFELRIYQSDEIFVENPDPEIIQAIMDKIIWFDNRIKKLQAEGV